MDKVKILVVEDEGIIAANICSVLDGLGYETLEPAVDYTEAISVIEEEMPDIAILDIQLSGRKTGIDLARKIREEYEFPFIFLTSNSDAGTIGMAKEVMPSAYLIKPFTKKELYSSIEIALYNYAKKEGSVNTDDLIIKEALFVKNKGAFTKILFNEIAFIKSDRVYIELHLKNKKHHVVRESMNGIAQKLSGAFIRVHRSFIINTNCLDAIENDLIKLGDIVIPIGETYKKDLLKRINIC